MHRFLFSAGLRALRHVRKPFERWIFGAWQEFESPWQTWLQLLAALAVLWSLVFLNSTIVAVSATQALTQSPPTWLSKGLIADLTLDFSMLVVVGLITASAFLTSYLLGKGAPTRSIKAAERAMLWILVWAMIVAIVLVGLFVLYDLKWHWDHPNGETLSQGWKNTLLRINSTNWPWALVGAIWLLVIGASAWVRRFFIQYFGDVAAYVDAYRLNAFCELRERIQKTALDLTEAVYQARIEGTTEHRYTRVIIVGHSLGSVVAYDTLNALIMKDKIANGRFAVVERTEMLLTFGSPLDKTAFIFRMQHPRESGVREALAAGVQPLIEDYKNRPSCWLNLWSSNDWVSGPLDYYDKKDSAAANRVENIRDPDANAPLRAHVMYRQGKLLRKILHKALTSPYPLNPSLFDERPAVHGTAQSPARAGAA